MANASFLVEEVGDLKLYGPFLSGEVTAGTLKPGMEAKAGHLLLIAIEIMDADAGSEKALAHAHRGQSVMIRPSGAPLEALNGLVGQTLEFTDLKSAPMSGKLFLKPDLT